MTSSFPKVAQWVDGVDTSSRLLRVPLGWVPWPSGSVTARVGGKEVGRVVRGPPRLCAAGIGSMERSGP